MKVIVRKPLPAQAEKKEEKEPGRRNVPWLRIAPIAAGLILYAASFQSGLGILKDSRFLRAPRRPPRPMAAAGLVLQRPLVWTVRLATRRAASTRLPSSGASSGGGGTLAGGAPGFEGRGTIRGIGTACLFALPFLLVERFAPFLAVLILGPFLLKITFAWRALEEHARAVDAGVKANLDEGREAAGRMVSRDTKALTREGASSLPRTSRYQRTWWTASPRPFSSSPSSRPWGSASLPQPFTGHPTRWMPCSATATTAGRLGGSLPEWTTSSPGSPHG